MCVKGRSLPIYTCGEKKHEISNRLLIISHKVEKAGPQAEKFKCGPNVRKGQTEKQKSGGVT
jgi:hypothetical protein